MNHQIPRLRIFAGPNGSGKSTIKDVVNKELLGVYINPDEIEKEIKQYDFLNLSWYDIETNEEEILLFFNNSTLLKKFDLLDEAELLRFNENRRILFKYSCNSFCR